VRGGTRLEANWVSGLGDLAMPTPDAEAPFHDSVLGVDCKFSVAGDGELRCLPAIDLLEWITNKVYADAACTIELTQLPQGCSTVGILQRQDDRTSCPGRSRRWRLGSALPPTTAIYRRYGSTCTADVQGSMQFYPRVQEADYTTFVKAKQGDGETRSGFTEVRLVADDGAVQVLGFRVNGSGPIVQPKVAADGVWRLLSVDPSDATIPWWPAYSDSTCTIPAAVGGGSCPTVGPYALTSRASPSGCGMVNEAFAVGARVDALHDRTWSTCEPVGDRLTGFAVGAEIPASTFPATPPVATSGRLVRPTFALGDGWLWLDGKVVDTSLGVTLIPGRAADGTERWLPDWSHLGSLYTGSTQRFSDAACTIPVASPPAGGCEASTWYVAESTGGTFCSGRPSSTTRIFSHGARHTGPTWERIWFPAEACSPSASTANVYEVGPEIPAATFAPVVVERR
jgi:hypothetical protein